MIPRRLHQLFHKSKRRIVDDILLRGYRRRFPPRLIIETTNRCTLRCSCCPNGHPIARRKPGIMSKETFDRIMANIDLPVRTCYLHMCGEPMLNPDLDYFCHRLLERKINPVIFSNGYGIDLGLLDRLLTMKGVRISFSMEVNSAATYDSIRIPGNLDKAIGYLDEIDAMFIARKRIYGLNIILRRGSTADMVAEDCRRLFSRFHSLQNISFSGEWPWPGLPETGDIAGHLSPRQTLCSQAKSLPAILWDGTASFCNLDYAGEMIVGNVAAVPLSKIINNRDSRRFRRRLMGMTVPDGAFCNRCIVNRFEGFSLNVTRARFTKAERDGSSSGIFHRIGHYFNSNETKI